MLLLGAAPGLAGDGRAQPPDARPGERPPAPLYEPPTAEQRLRWYAREAFGPMALARTGAGALAQQMAGAPPEWRQGVHGFGMRFASRQGRLVVQETIELGAASLLREDPRYVKCACRGALRRTGHALASTFLARDSRGKRVIALAGLGGIYGGAMISTAWYPARYSALGDGVRYGNLSLAITGGLNLVKEFWPSKNRPPRKDNP